MRKEIILLALVASAGTLVLAGCGGTPSGQAVKKTVATPQAAEPETEIQTAFLKLDPEDRTRAAAQRWCAVADANRLGSMGTPFKVMVQDQPIFLCCKGCQKQALADPDKTLARAGELKAKAAQ